ncbi:MAG TPA: PAS domain-containing protein [Acidimicrobiales bacterium]|nr:PAS domain-containing protein [Acidimicrobiales bacterium]
MATDPAYRAALFDLFMENTPTGFAILDRECRYLVVNPVLADGHGRSVSDHIGRRVAEVAPRAWSNLSGVYERVLAGEVVANLRLSDELVSELPQRRQWLASYYPMRIEGDVVGVGIIAHDVSELTDTQRVLEERSRLYAMLAATNRAVIEAASPADLFTTVCRVAVEVGGFALAWVGVPDGTIVDVATKYGRTAYLDEFAVSLDPDDVTSRGPTGRALAEGTPQILNDFLAADMARPWHQRAAAFGFRAMASFPVREAGRVVATFGLYSNQVGYFTDELVAALSEITPVLSFALDRFASERVREADEAMLRTHDRALRAISQGVLITSATGEREVIYASPSFLTLTGYDENEILGRSATFLDGPETDPSAVAAIDRAIAEERETLVELINYRKDGTPFWNRLTLTPVLDERGRASHFVGVNTDITAAREMESQLLQSQKLEALGTLAGGVAHDFNNMLLVIRGYSGLLAQRLDDASLREMAQRIDAAVEKAADFTRRLLTFSRGQMVRPQRLDLSEVVREALNLLERIIGEDIVVRLDLASELPAVVVDRAQLEQAILNLVTNARESMSAGGSLEVRTALVHLDQDYADRHPEITPGPHVTLRVTDSGEGMDQATLARAFEPFYTTKPSGTGLGLSTVYGIVRRCGGHVQVTSSRGSGTTVTVYLPAVSGAIEERAPEPRASTSPRGRETLLVVEDVDEARDLVSAYLADLGYRVVVARDGLEALERMDGDDALIDALITDVVMPRMNGRELAARVLERHPETAVLFTSGFPRPENDEVTAPTIRSAFLEKPYGLAEMAHALRDLLDGVARTR